METISGGVRKTAWHFALAPAASTPPTQNRIIGGLIGDFQRAPVQTHHPIAPEKGSLCARIRERLYNVFGEMRHHLPAQSGAGGADPRFANVASNGVVAQRLHAFGHHTEHFLAIHPTIQ